MRKTIFFILLLSLLLAACSGPKPAASEQLEAQNQTAGQAPATAQTEPAVEDPDSTAPPTGRPGLGWWVEEQPRQDAQGEVEVTVTPLNLNNPGQTLDFEVTLNTHSVDLSMDLSAMSTLETDTGLSAAPLLWDAEVGGHHVSGTLSFPADSEGQPLLENVKTLTLSIVDVDVPERVFVWERE